MARRRNKKQSKGDETLVDLVEVKDQAQGFLDQYQTYIFIGLVAVVLAIGGVFAYNNFYIQPKQVEAVDQMAQAQLQFSRDSFALALTNPGGGYAGFLDIADTYKGTKAGNLANYYAGICYLHLGEYAGALDYLNDFKPAGDVLPIMKFGAMADAFAELQDLEKAMKYYEKAVAQGGNDFLVSYYLKKVGLLHENNGETDQALKAYSKIKSDFPDSPISNDIDKYISRVEIAN